MKTKKMFSKVFALLLAVVTVLAMSVTAFAQDKSAGEGPASITISNPASGETYSVYKIFDATYGKNGENSSIAYTVMDSKKDATLPSGFSIIEGTGNYVTGPTSLSDDQVDSLVEYVASDEAIVSETSDGSTLVFSGLEYGYYLIKTTHVDSTTKASAVTVDSTNPNAEIHDKNQTSQVGGLTKTVSTGQDNVNIGDTVTYTIEFTTTNFDGKDPITKYIIEDTLPEFLEDVSVTSVKIGGTEYKTGTPAATPSFTNKKIEIPWATLTTADDGTESYSSIYANGAKIEITYTAKVGQKAAIAGAGNSNTVTISYDTSKESGKTPEKNYTSTETIKTYAVAIQKMDDKGNKLAGATFSIAGVVATQDKNADGTNKAGYWTVSSVAENNTATVMSTDANGVLVVKGLKSGTELSVTEVSAPAGYNKLSGPVTVTPVATEQTSSTTTTYIDDKGEVSKTETTTYVVTTTDVATTLLPVINETGTELPSTGGIGTTIFYVVGTILVAGAAVALIVRKRMSSYQD